MSTPHPRDPNPHPDSEVRSDDHVVIEIVPGSGRYVRLPRRRGPVERLRARRPR